MFGRTANYIISCIYCAHFFRTHTSPSRTYMNNTYIICNGSHNPDATPGAELPHINTIYCSIHIIVCIMYISTYAVSGRAAIKSVIV